jgi:hypothetical protein
MSRNIQTIYQEAVETRNKYLQLTTADTTRLSGSKMSVMNMFTYVMSSLIYTFENMFDVFIADATKVLGLRTNGTPAYYVYMAKQYSPGCTVRVNEDGTGLEVISNGGNPIIPYASYETINIANGMVLKVCKDVNGAITPLTSQELSAFTNFINQIRFVGANVIVRSVPADLITPKIRVVYDDSIVSKEDALANIKEAIDNYSKSLSYDSYVYQSAIIDAIQGAFGVLDVPSNLSNGEKSKIFVQKHNYASASGYDNMVEITGWYRPYSGYLTTMSNGSSTISEDNIEIQSRSEYMNSGI